MTNGERPNGGSDGWLLSIDFGTTATAAVTVTGGQVSRPLALDGAGRMSSSVYSAPPEAVLKVGKLADHEAGYALDRFEPTPKRKIDKPVVRLGGTSYTPAELVAAIFRRVLTEAVRQHNTVAPARVVLTHPVRWPPDRVAVLGVAAHSAARESGVVLPDPEFVPEPVAAAQWYARDNHHEPLQPGQRIAVYDLGGGTFDTTVLERTGDGYEVLAKGGIDPLGGYDFDFRLFTHLGDRHIGPANPGLWEALQIPNPDDVDMGWKRRRMQDSVQLLKEQLSDETSEETHLPGVPSTVLVTRGDFEGLIADDVDRTIDELTDTLAEAELTPSDLTAIYRIGGASRTPLVGQRLEALRVPVRTLDDPKLVVALGASVTPAIQPATPPKPPPQPESPKKPIGPDSGTTSADTQTAEPATHDESTTKPPADRTATADEHRQGTPSTRRYDALGRWSWASVLTGSLLLTVSVVVCLLPYGQDVVPVFVRVGVSAVVGALLVTTAARSGGRARRGWMLAGIVLVTAGIAAGLKRLVESFLEEGSLDLEVFLGGLAACSVLGVLLVVAPQWRGRPRWGAVIAFVVVGSAILAAAVAIFEFKPDWRWNSAAPGTVAVATGLALVLAGVIVWRRRRKVLSTESTELSRAPTGIGTISVGSDALAGKSEGKRLRLWIGLPLVATLVVAAVIASIRFTRDSGGGDSTWPPSTTPAVTSGSATGTPSATPAPTTARAPQTIVSDPVYRDRNNALINSIAVGDCFTSVLGGALTTATCGAPGSQQVTRRTSNPNDCPANELPLQATDTNQIVCLRDMA